MQKKEVLCAVIGGVVGAVLVMVAGQFSPRVGQIACSGLEVVDSKGNSRVRLSADEQGGSVDVLSDGLRATMFTNGRVAFVSVHGEDRKASMVVVGEEVTIGVSGGGIPPPPLVDFDEQGRQMVVYPRDDKPEAKMGIGQRGGYVHVSGGHEDYRSKAMMYIAPKGGAISTRDKNGNRLADLK